MRFERLFVYLLSHLSAKFRDAVASRLSNCVVVGLRLANVVGTDLGGELADHLSAFVTEDLLPRLLGVDFDTLSNVVAIQTHPGNQEWVVLLSERIVGLGNVVESPGCLRSGIPDLRPVVSET